MLHFNPQARRAHALSRIAKQVRGCGSATIRITFVWDRREDEIDARPVLASRLPLVRHKAANPVDSSTLVPRNTLAFAAGKFRGRCVARAASSTCLEIGINGLLTDVHWQGE